MKGKSTFMQKVEKFLTKKPKTVVAAAAAAGALGAPAAPLVGATMAAIPAAGLVKVAQKKFFSSHEKYLDHRMKKKHGR